MTTIWLCIVPVAYCRLCIAIALQTVYRYCIALHHYSVTGCVTLLQAVSRCCRLCCVTLLQALLRYYRLCFAITGCDMRLQAMYRYCIAGGVSLLYYRLYITTILQAVYSYFIIYYSLCIVTVLLAVCHYSVARCVSLLINFGWLSLERRDLETQIWFSLLLLLLNRLPTSEIWWKSQLNSKKLQPLALKQEHCCGVSRWRAAVGQNSQSLTTCFPYHRSTFWAQLLEGGGGFSQSCIPRFIINTTS